MPKHLTQEQLDAYQRDGAVSPVPLLSREEAGAYRKRFDALEAEIGAEAQSRYRIKAHLPFPWLTELIHHPKLLDAIEDVMGPDLVVWGTSFFTKKARDPRFRLDLPVSLGRRGAGMKRMQPLASVESENAIQAVTDSGGSRP